MEHSRITNRADPKNDLELGFGIMSLSRIRLLLKSRGTNIVTDAYL